MRLIAVLSWFNESPSWLSALAASAARVCDHLVAVDGRYMLFHHDMPVSPTSEAQALIETCEGAGLALTLHRPSQPYAGNEIEKRNLLLRLALVHAEPMRDWIIVLDGDEYIRSADRDLIRHELATTDLHVAEYGLEEYIDPHDEEAPLNIAAIREIPMVHRTPIRSMYRALPGLRYERTHFTVAGEVNGETVWLWGDPRKQEALRLSDALIVRHRNRLRTKERRYQAAMYYEERDRLRIEDA